MALDYIFYLHKITPESAERIIKVELLVFRMQLKTIPQVPLGADPMTFIEVKRCSFIFSLNIFDLSKELQHTPASTTASSALYL